VVGGQDMVLAPLRAVDLLIHVVRVFEDESVPHPRGSIDPETRQTQSRF
jgi:ribosome-binding ATPase YchF (GTP1/OBG family)